MDITTDYFILALWEDGKPTLSYYDDNACLVELKVFNILDHYGDMSYSIFKIVNLNTLMSTIELDEEFDLNMEFTNEGDDDEGDDDELNLVTMFHPLNNAITQAVSDPKGWYKFTNNKFRKVNAKEHNQYFKYI